MGERVGPRLRVRAVTHSGKSPLPVHAAWLQCDSMSLFLQAAILCKHWEARVKCFFFLGVGIAATEDRQRRRLKPLEVPYLDLHAAAIL